MAGVVVLKSGMKAYSPSKYRVELGDIGRVRPATQQEWDTAFPVPLGDRFRPTLQQPRHGDNFVFRQRTFKKSGPKWPALGVDARISPDERWIAVQSWQGSDYRDGFAFFTPGALFGTASRFFVDLYEVEPLQQSSRPRERGRTVTARGAKNLDAGQSAGRPLGFAAEIAAQRQRLRLGDDKLHERGGIEIDHRV